MLFNSYAFIFGFLPVSAIVYFLLNRWRYTFLSKIWLAGCSLFFYSWWNVAYLPLILGSIAFNYSIGRLLGVLAARGDRQEAGPADLNCARKGRTRFWRNPRKLVLIVGILCNLLLLGYFKYADFLIDNVNALLSSHLRLLELTLPLGISFFTFTQIAYLVDAYRHEAREYDIVNYILFVTFFPHLIAGPILHHKEMMPQFDRLRGKRPNYRNMSRGCYIFCIGLFKKVVIADALAPVVSSGFDQSDHLNLLQGWIASLSYTLQLYFDFSGYTDMAIGAALLFNIRLPENFHSPYKSLNIQEFWRRWHMTLSRFLRDYIYIPLGGNRKGEARTCLNLLLTFLLGGIWHGAGWTFVLWGMLHGAALVIHRLWKRWGFALPRWLAWFITFQFINITWIFFRARHWSDAVKVLKAMFGRTGIYFSTIYAESAALVAVCLLIALAASNSRELAERFRPGWTNALFASSLFATSILYFNTITEFLYFNF